VGDKSKIEWTDATWNPVTGCDKISPGCTNCYAEGVAKRWWGERPFTDVQCHDDRLEQPKGWKKSRLVFVNSMSDLFHEKVPDSFIAKVFEMMNACPQHKFQVLTKRPARMKAFLKDFYGLVNGEYKPIHNVWLGVSVENQKTADERLPLLLQTPAEVRFVSCEPLLDEVDLMAYMDHGIGRICPACGQDRGHNREIGGSGCSGLDWVIVGGESGHSGRPMKPAWPNKLHHQCKVAKVMFFFKQWGKWMPGGTAGMKKAPGPKWKPEHGGGELYGMELKAMPQQGEA